ncbi:hypothetical protein GE061_006025 [Apolygus lucorum]|uniref:Uncharacterized protein n=1 Tax=Apolygus lucorum TaxID=248454 RepID=A0A8S9WST4_APOLU|nr:hypothetical protein GE061_006025 [Apolygus lucorum]
MKMLPYREYIKESLQKAMQEDNDKRHLVTNFQLMLNKVDDDYRHDNGMKQELYVRAKELYDMMTAIAMDRRERALIKKQDLVAQGWVANQAYTLANLYLSMMQVELDLYLDSLQVLNDYYVVPPAHRDGPSFVCRHHLYHPEPNPTYPLISHYELLKGKIQDLNTIYQGIANDPELGKELKGKKMGDWKKAEARTDGLLALPSPERPLTEKDPKRRASERKSMGGKRKSQGGQRKSQGGQRKSQGGQRKSTASKRKSTGGKRKSQGGQRKSQGGQRKSTASKRKSTGGKRKSSVKRQSIKNEKGKGKQRSGKGSAKSEEDDRPDMVDVAKEEWSSAINFATRR